MQFPIRTSGIKPTILHFWQTLIVPLRYGLCLEKQGSRPAVRALAHTLGIPGQPWEMSVFGPHLMPINSDSLGLELRHDYMF